MSEISRQEFEALAQRVALLEQVHNQVPGWVIANFIDVIARTIIEAGQGRTIQGSPFRNYCARILDTIRKAPEYEHLAMVPRGELFQEFCASLQQILETGQFDRTNLS